MCPPWTLISRSSWAMMTICKWKELAWELIRPDGQKNIQLNIYSLKKCWHRFNFLINPLLVRTDAHIVILIVDSCFDWKTMAMGDFFPLLQISLVFSNQIYDKSSWVAIKQGNREKSNYNIKLVDWRRKSVLDVSSFEKSKRWGILLYDWSSHKKKKWEMEVCI